jgi:hypothetical protein
MALVYRSVTWPCSARSNVRRDRDKFRAVKTSAPAAPSVRRLPRAFVRAVPSAAPVTDPTSCRASQSATGTSSRQAITTASTTAAIPAPTHRIPLAVRKR